MRRFDKIKNLKKANLLVEQRYLQSKGLIDESTQKEMFEGELTEATTVEDKLNELVGTPINLIRTKHTTGKYNPEKGEMDKVSIDEPIDGVIGEIVNDGVVKGIKVMNPQGSKISFLMYDKKIGKFIDGDSTFSYTYEAADDKSERILQFILRYLVGSTF
jgi:hypothetical protein